MRTKLPEYLDKLLELPVRDYRLERTLASHGVIDLDQPALTISTARSPFAAAYAYDHWLETVRAAGYPFPSFGWDAVASFHPDDPLVLVHVGNAVQAMMQLRENHIVRCPAGDTQRLVYVSFLEVAPWNQKSQPDRSFRGLGQLMLRVACERSTQLGHDGRVGLHAVAGAEGFYRSLGFSSSNCPNEFHELYLELSSDAARSFQDREAGR